ncbi:squamosa promoter-binding-like protein 14 [Juglans microcarpa x Juglans regia]|uniref:squamosa promoter-binding-like protein 14 n=1 Tax=Juglans microcarpa x Juglans regia TaxID=2249226 RepID=UPI001B7E97B6|nr:squamosa promoter-binding-like protein 14 [Juglans microcarpa x Juglans regia]XP_041017691.1 squamosa promoter-binding-like protein 14 [Juglans microcarpa x Juglans regia]XP_041017692.1 squamosa promoter-binding-like protein 14 [Juglans microcarpa x Juglans regia]
MEEAGPQVASPIFIHQQTLPGPFSLSKKRDLPNIQAPQRMMTPTPGLQNPVMDNWNPNVWGWDSFGFVAKPVDLRLGTPRTTTTTTAEKNKPLEEEDESLMLNLGGGLKFVEEDSEPPSRSNKRVRSGSPGSGGNYPMCQVDNCKEDLSNAKDYHRRHKVCEIHSKSSKALVANQMQRFCQQCSRFHPLSEFDEGKRSCRRRLAGHNRRRRKTQPEDVASRLLLPGRDNNASTANLDIVNLLAAIARAQGKNEDKTINCSSVPDRDHLVQILSKINSLSLPTDLAAKLPNLASLTSKLPGHASLEHQIKLNGNTSSPSTMDLLTVLSATPATPTPDATTILSQKSSQSSDSEKTKVTYADQATPPNLQKRPPLEFPSVGGDRSSSSYQSPMEDSDGQVQDARVNLPLQLFGSSTEDDSLTKLASSMKYFSSDSSNPIEERSPSSSPVQNLFPMRTKTETMKPEKITIGRGLNANIVASRTADCNRPFDLFRGSNTGAEPGSFQSFPYQAGYASSGSDHSPSSLNSDAQDRTGRIIFKLFDKDPSHFPVTLRTEIYHWLSNRPSEMESFIRPGCVVLSIYVSMSSAAWEQLEQNLLERVNALVESSDSDFWRSGRFIVHTGRQLASHKDGKIRLCKSWRTWSSPELILVSPLAVVGGQETPLLLKGRNLSNPGAKIHCTSMGGYISKEITESTCQRTSCDEINLVGFKIQSEAPGVIGRCFIEVENGFKGSCFPVIIADSIICEELRLLESEFDLEPKEYNVVMEDNKYDFGRPKSREEVLHFLNELGWLFQRKGNTSMLGGPDYSLSRLRFLLTFSVERDCCALVRAILDILVERNLDGDELSRESLETLSEIQLLNRAVKRRCRKMVNMLINYFIISSKDASRKYIFLPNVVGPGGVTPLHLAACTSGSDDLIDALTSDPQEIGLNCWTSLLDSSGQSPYAYAMMRSNHSYNKLVARKLTDRENGQVSVTVMSEIEQSQLALEQEHRIITQFKQGPRSCVSCAVVARKYNMRVPASQGLLQRPFINSMLAIAAVCVCVCLFLRGSPDIGSVAPFKWENLDFGTM